MKTPQSLFSISGIQRGAVLIMVLWLIVVLSVMAYSLSYEVRIGLKMTSQAQKRVQAQALARIGLAKAVMDLRNDRLIAMANQGQNTDTPDEPWAQNEDKTDLEVGDHGMYNVRIVDEERKINVNMFHMANVGGLIYLLEEVGDIKEDEAYKIAHAVIDFADPDLIPSTNEGSDEIEYYTEWGLEEYGDQLPAGWSFRPKNDIYIHVEELMEIPGITREVLYGEMGDKKVPIDPFVRIDEGEELPVLADYLTAGSVNRVNLNTCSLTVLEAMLSSATEMGTDARGAAEKIDDLRQGLLEMGDEGASGITNPRQLADAGLDETTVQTLETVFPLGVSSYFYTILTRGEYKGVRQTYKVLVNVTMESYNIDEDNPDTFGKRDHRASGLLRDQPLVKVDPAVRVVRIEEM